MRSSSDDGPAPAGLPDFYRRARGNAVRADIEGVNRALLLATFLVEVAHAIRHRLQRIQADLRHSP